MKKNIITAFAFLLICYSAYKFNSYLPATSLAFLIIRIVIFLIFLAVFAAIHTLHVQGYVRAGNIIFRRAALVKAGLERMTINAESGHDIEDHIFWALTSLYESRLFGICVMRANTVGSPTDYLTDRYIAAKIKTGKPLLESLKPFIKPEMKNG